VARAGQTQLVEVSVRGPWREESAKAANRLAETVVERVSGYVDSKISALGQLAGSQEHELDRLGRQLDENEAAIASGTGLEPVERLTLANLGVILEQRRGQLVEDLLQTRQLLTLAQDVERAQVVTEAAAVQVAARSKRNAMLVGGVIGLIAGALLALVWEPLGGRRLHTRA